MKGWRIKRN